MRRAVAAGCLLQQLPEHLERCDFAPARCRHAGCARCCCGETWRRTCATRARRAAGGPLPGGCGLPPTHGEQRAGGHCCARSCGRTTPRCRPALGALHKALQEGGAAGRQAREVPVAAGRWPAGAADDRLRYQKKFTEYSARLDLLSRCVAAPPGGKVGARCPPRTPYWPWGASSPCGLGAYGSLGASLPSLTLLAR